MISAPVTRRAPRPPAARGAAGRCVFGAVLGAAVLAAPTGASAHLVGVEFGDFYAGSLHFLIGPAHVAGVLAVAMLGALHPQAAARGLLFALPLGLVIGVAAATWARAGGDAGYDALTALTLAGAGLLGALAVRLPAPALVAVGAAVGAVFGYLNGVSAQDPSIDWPLYAAGVASAGSVLGVLLIAVASAATRGPNWSEIAIRTLSSWVAAMGLVYFGLTFLSAPIA